ncbi:MAG: hypothetical protein ACTIDT_01015 [Halomonas sp.]|uniref:defense against restriction DarA-related protein n=1 Tax=unclassified Halomonas TaxID=2609666 RepID=UPI003FB6BEC3
MTASSPPVLWNDQSGVPLGISLDQLLYRIRRSDSDDGLIFDSVTLDDILEDADAVYELDALVSTGSMLSRKITTIERIMNASGKSVSVAASQVSSPFKRQGVINVAAIFELSDGQTVTIMFHNPDAGTTKALKPSDELISWKWLLNKKDITIIVAPERGSDVPIRQVARRIMGLAEKNSKTFARMNQKRAERLEYIDGLKGEIGELETELNSLTQQIEIANIEAEDAALNAPKPVTAKEGLDLLDDLRPWLSRQQYRAMADVIRNGEDSAAYIDRAKVLASIIDGMAETYEQEGKGDEATAYLHYSQGGGNWYITEKDAKGNGTEQAFGLANAAPGDTKLGHIGVDELTGAGVELDLYFDPKPLSQVTPVSEEQPPEPQAEPEEPEPEAVPDELAPSEALIGVNEDGELAPEGAENIVKTAKGTEVQTGFTVVEASELIASHDINGDPNPAFPEELQPRDRGRDASIAWVKKTARQLDPDSLGRTRRADTGAPIVGPDRVVESGNGRTMAIQEAYRSGSADEYREWLEEEAHHYNLDTGRIKAMKAPVLVRVRTSQIDRREFAVEANQDDKLSMTGTEKARADADRLDEALISKLTDDGNLLSAANRDFISGFLQSLGDTEAAQYMTTDGNPTGALIARVQAAIFSKAYNDDRLLELTADASKPEVANVISALNVSAPEFIRAQAADQAGTDALTSQIVDSVETSLNEQAIQAIIEATNLVRQAKANGASVEEVISQLGLFGDIPPATAAMAMFINQNNRSGKRLGVAFRAMAEFVRKEAERGQTVDMFGESQKATLEQIIAAANLELDKEYGEGSYAIESLDMFETPAAAPTSDAESNEATGNGGIRLYHGTAKGNAFSRFDASRAGRGVGKNQADQGDQIYLTASRKAAEWFAEKAEVAKQLENGGNPGANEDNSGTVLAFMLDASAQVLQKLSMPRGSQSQEVIQQARDEGFDAIAFPDQGFGTVEGDPRVGDMYSDGAPPTTYIILDESKLTPEGEVGGAPTEEELEQARQATDTDPTDAEKESGEYAQGDVSLMGLDIAIENPKGSERSSTTQEGEQWSVSIAHDYGYIKGTKGADGDEVDVFIGPDLESERVFVINQVDKDGEFDEHKVMLGFDSKEAAEQGYLSNYPAGWNMGSIQEMTVDELNAWLPTASTGVPAEDPDLAKVQASIDNPGEGMPHDQAMAKADAAINQAEALQAAKALIESDEFLSTTRDFTNSLGTIKGIDAGTMPGMERSLFVSSITNKIKTRAKRDPVLGGVLLAWLNEQMKKPWDKPAITSRNAVWKAVDDWERFSPIFDKRAPVGPEAIGNDPDAAQSAATNDAPEAPESQEETMRRQDREFLQSVIDGTVPDIHSPELADQILAIMERQTGDAETEEMIEQAGAAYERAMLSATEEL